uniref:Glutaredoxin domain-containing protein n=1 Tax=Candidatus Methanomethylicus mesodigestus TaxID=1867258 RepID=A0A7C3J2R0_9CREN
MRIELYTSETCSNCRKLKKLLPELLSGFGLKYEEVIVERNVEDSDVLADLLLLNTEIIPALHANGLLLNGEATLKPELLKNFIEKISQNNG